MRAVGIKAKEYVLNAERSWGVVGLYNKSRKE
jgi:hypothetical protein